MSYKLGDIIIWETQWGTKLMGKIVAKFLDHCNTECLYCQCIDVHFSHPERDLPFEFIAAASSCKIFLGKADKRRPELLTPPLVPSKY